MPPKRVNDADYSEAPAPKRGRKRKATVNEAAPIAKKMTAAEKKAAIAAQKVLDQQKKTAAKEEAKDKAAEENLAQQSRSLSVHESLPELVNDSHKYEIITITPPLKPSSFPRFSDGNVIIKIHPTDIRFHYQLHEEQIAIAIPRLCHFLAAKKEEPCQQLKNANAGLTGLILCELLRRQKDSAREFDLYRRPFTREKDLYQAIAPPCQFWGSTAIENSSQNSSAKEFAARHITKNFNEFGYLKSNLRGSLDTRFREVHDDTSSPNTANSTTRAAPKESHMGYDGAAEYEPLMSSPRSGNFEAMAQVMDLDNDRLIRDEVESSSKASGIQEEPCTSPTSVKVGMTQSSTRSQVSVAFVRSEAAGENKGEVVTLRNDPSSPTIETKQTEYSLSIKEDSNMITISDKNAKSPDDEDEVLEGLNEAHDNGAKVAFNDPTSDVEIQNDFNLRNRDSHSNVDTLCLGITAAESSSTIFPNEESEAASSSAPVATLASEPKVPQSLRNLETNDMDKTNFLFFDESIHIPALSNKENNPPTDLVVELDTLSDDSLSEHSSTEFDLSGFPETSQEISAVEIGPDTLTSVVPPESTNATQNLDIETGSVKDEPTANPSKQNLIKGRIVITIPDSPSQPIDFFNTTVTPRISPKFNKEKEDYCIISYPTQGKIEKGKGKAVDKDFESGEDADFIEECAATTTPAENKRTRAPELRGAGFLIRSQSPQLSRTSQPFPGHPGTNLRPIAPDILQFAFPNKSGQSSRLETANPNLQLQATTRVAATQVAPPLEICQAYDNLFRICYHKSTTISNQDIICATSESEELLKLAEYFQCVSIVRPSVCEALQSFGRSLYVSILNDPPRYLILGEKLRNKTIFEEAMIHIVGQHPFWPAQWTLSYDQLSDTLQDVICYKIAHLYELCNHVDSKLLTASISIDGVRIHNFERTPRNFGAGYAVSLWHDWLMDAILAARNSSVAEYASQAEISKGARTDESDGLNKMGPAYRAMARSGDAYLNIREVLDQLPDLPEHVCEGWTTVEEDLGFLKKSAQRFVEPVVRNNSWLDPEAFQPEYLTCTTLSDQDLPWSIRRVEFGSDKPDAKMS